MYLSQAVSLPAPLRVKSNLFPCLHLVQEIHLESAVVTCRVLVPTSPAVLQNNQQIQSQLQDYHPCHHNNEKRGDNTSFMRIVLRRKSYSPLLYYLINKNFSSQHQQLPTPQQQVPLDSSAMHTIQPQTRGSYSHVDLYLGAAQQQNFSTRSDWKMQMMHLYYQEKLRESSVREFEQMLNKFN